MHRSWGFCVALLLGSLAACTPAPVGRPLGGCQFASDCTDGEQCIRGRCVGSGNAPSRCTSDDQCGADQRCSALYGECVAGARSCTSELECSGAGLHCNRALGVCAQCNVNEHCGLTAVCIDGVCADPLTAECAMDLECLPPRTVCTGGRCVAGCTADSCSVGLTCNPTTGRCDVNQNACLGDTDCAPPSTVCEPNGCVPGCVEPGGECNAAEICNTATGRCEAVNPTCANDNECGAPAQICLSGQCVDGCATTGCVAGQTCNATTGHCEQSGPTLLPLNGTCMRNGDCESDVCFDFGGGVGRRCVESCGSSTDCPVGFTCHVHEGARMCVNATLFAGSPTFTEPAGAQCTEDGQCRSGLCDDSSCLERCTVDGDCPTGSCRWYETGQFVFDQACNGPGPGAPVGSTCDFTSDCQTGVCLAGGSTSIRRCLRLCDTTSDCANGSVCSPIDYSECTNGSFDDCNRWRIQGVRACVEDNHGNGAFGTSCSDAFDCRSMLCNPSINECTDTCATDADCPSNYRCKVDILFELPEGSSLRPFFFNVCMPETR